MRRIREVLRLKFNLGLNDSQVASSAGVARATVQDYLRRIAATGLDHEQLLALGDEALDQRLFPPRERREAGREEGASALVPPTDKHWHWRRR